MAEQVASDTKVDPTLVGTHLNPKAEQAALSTQQAVVLEALERKSVPGAYDRTPKGKMFEIPKTMRESTEYHYRWMNTKSAEKALQRTGIDGYTVVPAEEGGRRIGDEYALVRTSKANHADRVNRINELTRSREKATRSEYGQVVESVERMIRDRYGKRVSLMEAD